MGFSEPVFPEIPRDQFAVFQKEINVNIEVDSHEHVHIEQNGDMRYQRLPDERATGYFEGYIFGVYFQTDMIDHREIIYRAATLFKKHDYDVAKTGESIKKEYREYLWDY